MGFDVIGPTRRANASNIDDGGEPRYDLFALAAELNLTGPQLQRLSDRFYASTTVSFESGSVAALHNELIGLREEYRRRREPELARERGVRACNPTVRRSILNTILEDDTVDRALSDLILLCQEAHRARPRRAVRG